MWGLDLVWSLILKLVERNTNIINIDARKAYACGVVDAMAVSGRISYEEQQKLYLIIDSHTFEPSFEKENVK